MIEAGLGGRYDATNVIPSKVQVLTSVGLEHTRWLGPTIADIAGEKLDVVQPGATLVLGAGLDPEASEVAAARRRRARRRDRAGRRRSRRRGRRAGRPSSGATSRWPGPPPRRSWASSTSAPSPRPPPRSASRAGCRRSPQRRSRCSTGPTIPTGCGRWSSRCPALVAGHERVVAVVSILDDKDAAGMLRALLPACDAVVLTSSQNPRALPPPTLQSLATQLGGPPSEIVPDPARALARARELAGRDGVVLATGSLYLVADLLAPARARAGLDPVNDDRDQPSFLSHDRAGRAGRRGRDPRLLRDRLPVRAGVPVAILRRAATRICGPRRRT